MKRTTVYQLLLMGFVLVGGCGITPIEYDDTMLDGKVYCDTSLTDSTFRLSTHPGLDTIDREKPVMICVHGYTASTFEWIEFREYAMNDGGILTSLVLLGGHGRTIEEFEKTTWKDWQAPVMEEFDALVEKGFKHISLAGSSTGGTLILEYLSRNAFKNKTVQPEHIFFIDPIVVPSSKLLHHVGFFGPILGNVPYNRETALEKRHWYTNKPESTIRELNNLCELMRGRLEDGITLPEHTTAKCFKAKVDDSVDPVTALLIKKGLRDAEGKQIAVEMIDSDYHVFTQLAARTDADENDYRLQDRVFREMADSLKADR